VTTNPEGFSITVDGVDCTAPHTFDWRRAKCNTIAAGASQSQGANRYLFALWSDGGEVQHDITVSADASTYSAHFIEQYLVRTAVSPAGGGSLTVSPARLMATTQWEPCCGSPPRQPPDSTFCNGRPARGNHLSDTQLARPVLEPDGPRAATKRLLLYRDVYAVARHRHYFNFTGRLVTIDGNRSLDAHQRRVDGQFYAHLSVTSPRPD